jgi:ABC-type sugar transport system ATPase subunit
MTHMITTGDPAASPIVVAAGITKSFGVTRALKGVDFSIRPGEVVALVGENGAGKSTLGKVLAGVHRPDAGTLVVNGEPVELHSTRDARQQGIAIVLQEFNLIPEMTVAENLCLTRDDTYVRGWWRQESRQRRHAVDAIARLGLDFGIDPDAVVGSLSIAQQQLVEIVRALSGDARLFILDEPTAALGRREADALLDVIRLLRNSGCAVVIVTHRLDEVYAVADRIVVLRDGEKNGDFDPTKSERDVVVNAMIGRELGDELRAARSRSHEIGEVGLSVNNLLVSSFGAPVSFKVHRGEIVGIAGLVGSGRTELVRAIFGADRAKSGTVEVGGNVGLLSGPAAAVVHGLGLVPEDRKQQGLHLQLSIYENATLAMLAKDGGFWLKERSLRKAVDLKIRELRIKIGHMDDPGRSLSGGNQQKVVLAKWLLANPAVLILDEPTRGIDVGARADFYRLIDQLVTKGLAVVVISSELPEVMALSDRILVMSAGGIVAEVPAEDVTEAMLLSYTEIGTKAS